MCNCMNLITWKDAESINKVVFLVLITLFQEVYADIMVRMYLLNVSYSKEQFTSKMILVPSFIAIFSYVVITYL